MTNLLSEEKKKLILYEFWLRNIIVCLSFSFVTICFATILLLPSFVLSGVKEVEISNSAEISRKSIEFREKKSPIDLLAKEKEKFSILAQDPSTSASFLIDEIVKKRPAGIKINSFIFKWKTDSNKPDLDIIFSGVADDRNVLISFVNRLKEDKLFKKVDFPVSDLVKGEVVNFTIDIKIL